MEQQPITVDLDDALYAQLCSMAAEAKRSVGDYVGDIIEEEMGKLRASREIQKWWRVTLHWDYGGAENVWTEDYHKG